MVYPWHKSGSLNNDSQRPSNGGNRSAILETKKISNKLYAYTHYGDHYGGLNKDFDSRVNITGIGLFDSDEVSLLKLNNNNYYGNIDTLITPTHVFGTVYSSKVSPQFNDELDDMRMFEKDASKYIKSEHDGDYVPLEESSATNPFARPDNNAIGNVYN
jgi:hypothetical protein